MQHPCYNFHLWSDDPDVEDAFTTAERYPSADAAYDALMGWAQDLVVMADMPPGTYEYGLEVLIDEGADLDFVRTGYVTLG